MKTSNKGFDQCGNARAVVNEKQIILTADVTNQANDARQVAPMLGQVVECLKTAGVKETPRTLTAAAYVSEANVAAAAAMGIGPFIATQRLGHHEEISAAPKGRLLRMAGRPKTSPPKQKMAHKLRSQKGRATYSQRKGMIEPVFGQIKAVRGFRQFLMRGIKKMRNEWTRVCLTHNLLKLRRAKLTSTRGASRPDSGDCHPALPSPLPTSFETD